MLLKHRNNTLTGKFAERVSKQIIGYEPMFILNKVPYSAQMLRSFETLLLVYRHFFPILVAVFVGLLTQREEFASTNSGFFALGDTNDAIPPDTHGAVGPDHVMTVLNTQVRIQRKSGEHVRTASLQSFWSPLGDARPFDPKAAYDNRSKRWIVVAAGNRGAEDSSVLLAISDTSDPSGNWKFRRIRGETGTSRFVDYPSIGLNDRWVAIQYLERTTVSNLYVQSQLLLFERADLLAGAESIPKRFTVETADYVQTPAMTFDETDDLYLASVPARAEGPVRTLKLHVVRGRAGSEQLDLVQEFTMPDSWASRAPGAGNLIPQAGTSAKLHVQEAWMHSVIVRNGSVWVCHPIFLPDENPTRAAVQWAELTETDVRQVGRIEDVSRSYLYPSMAVNSENDVLIGFSVSSVSMYASAGFAVRSNSDDPGTMRPPVIFKEGVGPYLKTKGTGKNRWGDYSNTVVDPSDEMTFWTVQQYAEAPEGDSLQDGSGRWGTWWARIQSPSAIELKIAARKEGMDIVLMFSTEIGARYRIEKTTQLEIDWLIVEETVGTGAILTFKFPIAAGSNFFRVVQD